MPRYFFDIDDGDHQTRDEDGIELADMAAARESAIGVLPGVARDVLPDGDRRDFIVHVRDEDGRVIFKAKLALTAEWCTPIHDGRDR